MFECSTVLAYIYRTYGALRELSVGFCRGEFLVISSICWLGPVAPAPGLACVCLQMNVWSSGAWYLIVMFCVPVLVLSMPHF
jgi:hypothetical protein